ncbi:MAG: sulfatase [Verrucomicrobia subdivision 3 bacterium]|nr:sulfatase [Limisphaerales bacterium]
MRSAFYFLSVFLCVLCGSTNTQAAERPNILFAIADDWGFGDASAYGSQWVKTPAFDRVAREGILFTRAYTPNAKCAPSRATILTGRYSWQLEEAANHMNVFPAKFGSFVEVLAANGYTTACTGKGWGPGIANDVNGKRRLITGTPINKRFAKPPAKAMSNRDYAGNFEEFLKTAAKGKPWCFWFGTHEPHRAYEKGVGLRMGKKLSDIDHVPAFWPDNAETRGDMLDYAIEVEHYDRHLGRILAALEKAGQLDNTLIVATSDHGMPFPRCKGQAYDYSNHIPLAIRWPKGIQGRNRTVVDFVNFTDLAPTFLQAAGVNKIAPLMQPMSGRSLFDIFASPKSGQVIASRDHVVLGKERHDVGRPNNQGYPIRGIRKGDHLYLHNFEPNRWPVGNPETGYLNTDASPIKTLLLNQRREGNYKYWQLNFGKRPAEELFNVKTDRDCVKDLADSKPQAALKASLKKQLFAELKKQGDPRMFGRGDVFEKYGFAFDMWDQFYEKYQRGEKIRTGWVLPSDYEKEKLD